VSRLRFLVDVVAFCVPFLIGIAAAVWVMHDRNPTVSLDSSSVHEMPPVRRAVNLSLRTAVVILDQGEVDAAELLTVFGILSASNALNVVTVAPQQLPLLAAPDLGVMPDYGLEEYGWAIQYGGMHTLDEVEIVAVLPSLDTVDTDLVSWLQAKVSDSTWVLGSGKASPTLAAAGIVGGEVSDRGDAVNAPANLRWKQTGRVVTFERGTAVIDATFRVLSVALGDSVSRRTAERLRYELQPDPALFSLEEPSIRDRIGSYLTAGFVWDKPDVAVAIFHGVDELRLAAVLDLYPRVFDSDLTTVGVTRRPFLTRHGLVLVPRQGIDEEPKIHELLLPGEAAADDLDRFQAYCTEEEVPMYNPFGGSADSAFAYSSTLSRIAAIRGSGVAKVVANAVRYPTNRVAFVKVPHWPYDVLIVPVTFGLLVVFVVRLARKKRHPRTKSRV